MGKLKPELPKEQMCLKAVRDHSCICILIIDSNN